MEKSFELLHSTGLWNFLPCTLKNDPAWVRLHQAIGNTNVGAAPQVRQVRGSSTNTLFFAFVKKALSEPRSQSPCQGCIKVRITLVISKIGLIQKSKYLFTANKDWFRKKIVNIAVKQYYIVNTVFSTTAFTICFCESAFISDVVRCNEDTVATKEVALRGGHPFIV